MYASLLLFAYMINFLWLQIYCHKKFPEARFKLGWEKQMHKEMWNLTSWTMVGHISLIGYTQGITLLINLFFGPALNAAYSIANQANQHSLTNLAVVFKQRSILKSLKLCRQNNTKK